MVFKFWHKNSKDIHFLTFTCMSIDTIWSICQFSHMWVLIPYVWTFTHVSIDTIWRICQLSHVWALILYVWTFTHVSTDTMCLNFHKCEYWYYVFNFHACEHWYLYVWTLTRVSIDTTWHARQPASLVTGKLKHLWTTHLSTSCFHA